MRILAVDPGNVTGLAFLDTQLGEPSAWEDAALESVAWIEHHLDTLDVVVCESFIPRPGAYSWQPEALYTIGAIRYLCSRESVEFVLQSPADAKKFSSNEKLKRVGWYTPTRGGHANDAQRHLLLIAVKRGLVSPARLLPEGTVQ